EMATSSFLTTDLTAPLKKIDNSVNLSNFNSSVSSSFAQLESDASNSMTRIENRSKNISLSNLVNSFNEASSSILATDLTAPVKKIGTSLDLSTVKSSVSSSFQHIEQQASNTYSMLQSTAPAIYLPTHMVSTISDSGGDSAGMNKANNTTEKLKKGFGGLKGKIGKTFSSGTQKITGLKNSMEELMPVFGGLKDSIEQNTGVFALLDSSLGGVINTQQIFGGIANGITGVMSVMSTVIGVITNLTQVWTIVQKIFNVIMAMNPISLVIIAIVGLITALAVAFVKFEKFRGAVMGVFEVVKGFATLIKEFVVNRIKDFIQGITGLGKAVGLIFQGKFKEAAKAGGQAFKDLAGVESKKKLILGAKDEIVNIKDTFNKGYEKGLAMDPMAKINGLKDKLFPGKKDEKQNTDQTQVALAGNIQNTGQGIAEGGARPTTINITLGNLVEELNISKEGFSESVDDMEEMVREALLRVLNSANRVAYG
ncbi:MAG: hypothetical protein MI922_28135, partial [Bacteroidales bacterium]|nr:hypothetical protein [Bacteroidales bacterium]